jgi:hypothetical protein
VRSCSNRLLFRSPLKWRGGSIAETVYSFGAFADIDLGSFEFVDVVKVLDMADFDLTPSLIALASFEFRSSIIPLEADELPIVSGLVLSEFELRLSVVSLSPSGDGDIVEGNLTLNDFEYLEVVKSAGIFEEPTNVTNIEIQEFTYEVL